jgi:hypothetical protein
MSPKDAYLLIVDMPCFILLVLLQSHVKAVTESSDAIIPLPQEFPPSTSLAAPIAPTKLPKRSNRLRIATNEDLYADAAEEYEPAKPSPTQAAAPIVETKESPEDARAAATQAALAQAPGNGWSSYYSAIRGLLGLSADEPENAPAAPAAAPAPITEPLSAADSAYAVASSTLAEERTALQSASGQQPAAASDAAQTSTQYAARFRSPSPSSADASGENAYFSGLTDATGTELPSIPVSPLSSAALQPSMHITQPETPLSLTELEYLTGVSRTSGALAHSPLASSTPVAYFVRVVYNGQPLVLPGQQSEFCSLEAFRKLANANIPASFEAECEGRPSKSDGSALAASGDDIAFDTLVPDKQDLIEAQATRNQH